MSKAVIIGAGPAGLTAGYELHKLGMNSIVLEADTLVGGISRTVNYKGYRFDIGGHRFFTKVPYVRQLWEEILGEDFLVRPRLSRIHYRGHFFDYPLKALNALIGLGPVESTLVILSYAKTKIMPTREETNFEQWVANRFGYRLYNIFFKNYTEKVWGIPCNEISADWAAQRIKNLSLTEAVRNAIFGSGKSKDGKVITTLIEQFYYPRLGPGMMWESCEKILAEQGNPTIHGQYVKKVKHDKFRVESVVAVNQDGEETEYAGEQFISSMPLRELIFALDPAPPDKVLEAAHRLRYRDYLTVVLIVNREDVFPDNWIYIHTPEVKMGRIQNYKNWSPDMVPDISKTSLGLEYFLWEKDEEWTWPDERLIELGIKECSHLGLIERNEVIDGTVVRMKKAYPIYDRYYHSSVETLKNYLSEFTNLQTIGRNGLHRYNNQDHSMLTAVYAARNIFGECYDVWSVNTETEYHEEGEVKAAASGDRLIPTRIEPKEEVPTIPIEEVIESVFAKLDPLALGGAVGFVSGLLLFLATAILLLKGGPVIGPTLSLLGNYLVGYKVTWPGAFIGFLEAGLGGFIMGYVIATLRNWAVAAYAYLIKRNIEKEESKDLLDKV
ncbi:MAG: NAD(P)/FAD-dependent oxidoreductase [Calditrichaeota bacterium]|nr:MAG: NAD(P)/FAD-dependent oxidoreductase [Calditrichota bacterium]